MSDKRGEEDASDERTAISSKRLLGDLTHKKIKYYLSKNRVNEQELYAVFKEFFKDLLEIKKEYTCTELIKELDTVFLQNNTRAQITTFINKISVVEFRDNAFEDKETRKLFEELDEIVTAVIKFSGDPTEKGFFATLFSIFKKEKDEPYIAELENETKEEKIEPDKAIEKMTRRGKEKKAKIIEEEFAPIAPSEEKEIKDTGLDELDQQFEVQDLSDTDKKEVDEDQVKAAAELAKEKPVHKMKYELPPDDWSKPVKEKKTDKDSIADLEDSLDFDVLVDKKKKGKKDKKKIEKEIKPNPEPIVEELIPPPELDAPDVPKEVPEDITKLIKKAKKLKKKDMLEESYQKIIGIYNTLSDDEQDKFYDDIQVLFDKAQKAKN